MNLGRKTREWERIRAGELPSNDAALNQMAKDITTEWKRSQGNRYGAAKTPLWKIALRFLNGAYKLGAAEADYVAGRALETLDAPAAGEVDSTGSGQVGGEWTSETVRQIYLREGYGHANVAAEVNRIIADLHAQHIRDLDMLATKEQEIAELRTQLSQAGQDKERLDWLDKHCFTNREGEREIHYDFKGDLRKAIDSARKQEKE